MIPIDFSYCLISLLLYPPEASGIDLGPLLQGQTRIAKLKSAYNSLIIDPRGLGW